MKAQPIELADVSSSLEGMRRIAAVRFAEVLALGPALHRADAAGMHDLRIACKRLRYALERSTSVRRGLNRTAQQLGRLQDALGEVHDCGVLGRKLEGRSLHASVTALQRERRRSIDRGRRLWRRAFARRGSFKPLIAFTGLEGA